MKSAVAVLLCALLIHAYFLPSNGTLTTPRITTSQSPSSITRLQDSVSESNTTSQKPVPGGSAAEVHNLATSNPREADEQVTNASSDGSASDNAKKSTPLAPSLSQGTNTSGTLADAPPVTDGPGTLPGAITTVPTAVVTSKSTSQTGSTISFIPGNTSQMTNISVEMEKLPSTPAGQMPTTVPHLATTSATTPSVVTNATSRTPIGENRNSTPAVAPKSPEAQNMSTTWATTEDQVTTAAPTVSQQNNTHIGQGTNAGNSSSPTSSKATSTIKATAPTTISTTSTTTTPMSTKSTLTTSSTATALGHPSGSSTHEALSKLNVGDDDDSSKGVPDPLLAGLVSVFVIAAAIVSLLVFLKFRHRNERPVFRRLQDLPMDDMMEDTPLSMYSY